jgi:hypothetical protein
MRRIIGAAHVGEPSRDRPRSSLDRLYELRQQHMSARGHRLDLGSGRAHLLQNEPA